MAGPTEALLEEVILALRAAGARFAFLHGSQVSGHARPDSDVDVAAWWGTDQPPAAWEVDLPPTVDLLVLDTAPLELAGRVAQTGRLIFDDDPPARVQWQAQQRTIYLDERWRQHWISDDFLRARAHG